METSNVELREADGNIFVLYKNGLPADKIYDIKGTLRLDLADEFFDLSPAGLPEEKEIRIELAKGHKFKWFEFMYISRDKSILTVHLHCHFNENGEEESAYLLNVEALIAKITEEAGSYGLLTEESHGMESCADFKKKFSSRGILRDKIKTAIDIMETLRAKTESEMVETILKGNLFMKVPGFNKFDAEEEE